jgi:hypothetical protein
MLAGSRRLVGRLTKGTIAEFTRGVNNMLGIKTSDRFLGEMRQDTIASMVRRKMDSQIDKFLGAHWAHAVQTGYNSDSGFLGNIFSPVPSNYLYPDSGAPGVKMSNTGEALFEGKMKRLEEDVQDWIDRILLDNMHVMVNAARARGTTIDEVMHIIDNGELNDTQAVEWNPNRRQFQWNLYRKKPTRANELEIAFINETTKRAERSGTMYVDSTGQLVSRIAQNEMDKVAARLIGDDPRPADSRAVSFNRSDPPVAVQLQNKIYKRPSPYPAAGSGPYPPVGGPQAGPYDYTRN